MRLNMPIIAPCPRGAAPLSLAVAAVSPWMRATLTTGGDRPAFMLPQLSSIHSLRVHLVTERYQEALSAPLVPAASILDPFFSEAGATEVWFDPFELFGPSLPQEPYWLHLSAGPWVTRPRRRDLSAASPWVAPSSSKEALLAAYTFARAKDSGTAVEYFRIALADEQLRGCLDRGNLYNAACAAALEATTGRHPSPELLEQAKAWLAEDLALCRARIPFVLSALAEARSPAEAAVFEAEVAAIRVHVAFRLTDPDLAALRPGSLA